MRYRIILFVVVVLQGCSGLRYSYEANLEQTPAGGVLHLKQGESTEVLAIGNGFPGWWGYYPALKVLEPSIARIDCKATRSAIPFREPGIVFGGKICELTAQEAGRTTVLLGNTFSSSMDGYTKQFELVVTEN